MHDQQIVAIDTWIALQDTEISRPEAIRRLVELGLTVGGKPKQTTAATADRAKELASKAIDSLAAGAPNMKRPGGSSA